MTKGELRAEEYRARAREASALADGAGLARVREQHERSAAAWTGMADAEEARLLRPGRVPTETAK